MDKLELSDIKRYKSKTIPQLIKIAQKHFNAFIRKRDTLKGCISCCGKTEEAGHFYSAGHYSNLRFNEDNVNGQCKKCNRHLHGNLVEYQKGLIKRIGDDQVDKLHDLADYYKRKSFKWDRFTLIEIIVKYRDICKENK